MTQRPALRQISRLAHRASGTAVANRMVPEETPVAFSFAGTTHAVMMASPADFEDFALGFSLTEGIISSPEEVEAVEVYRSPGEWPAEFGRTEASCVVVIWSRRGEKQP